jgi:hypothetical protein
VYIYIYIYIFSIITEKKINVLSDVSTRHDTMCWESKSPYGDVLLQHVINVVMCRLGTSPYCMTCVFNTSHNIDVENLHITIWWSGKLTRHPIETCQFNTSHNIDVENLHVTIWWRGKLTRLYWVTCHFATSLNGDV